MSIESRNRFIYVKLISLDWNEIPRAEIQGVVTGGSISCNGSAAMRRTCNLTLAVDATSEINEIYWGLRTKFKLYIGVAQPNGEPIWNLMGLYIIASYSQSLSVNNYTINISGKDKMCLLDGSIGGQLPYDINFDSFDIVEGYDEFNNIISGVEKIPIYKIIRNAIHVYAQEKYENIIIKDLEDCSVSLIQYMSNNYNLYIYSQQILDNNGQVSNEAVNMAFTGSTVAQKFDAVARNEGRESPIDGEEYIEGNIRYTLLKYGTYGTTVGYELTELIYPDDLVINAGGTIVQMLDNIKNLLGEFEYFYDKEGRFIFQRKHIYCNIAWTNYTNYEDGIIDKSSTFFSDNQAYNSASYVYEFKTGELIESFNNKPSIENIRNDFVVWGSRTTASGIKVPIHARYAIDEKPQEYYSIAEGQWFFADAEAAAARGITNPTIVDWRELIYLMALDDRDFQDIIDSAIHSSRTSLEDMLADTSSIVDKESLQKTLEIVDVVKSNLNMYANANYNTYYPDMLATGYWDELYSREKNWAENGNWNPALIIYNKETGQIKIPEPELLTFWIDFYDDDSRLGQYSVQKIGRRTKVTKDDKVKAIFVRETPKVLFIDPNNNFTANDTEMGYSKLQLTPEMSNFFRISTQGKSAETELTTMLYNNTYYNEQITISAVPVYYLEPNYRIKVYDETTHSNGEYIVDSITYQLNFDGMMSINAKKVEDYIV